MWALAGAIWAGLKWLTFADVALPLRPPLPRALGYLFLWPGMDAKAFLAPAQPLGKPGRREWFAAVAKTGCGLLLLCGIAPRLVDSRPLIAGWIGMIGIALVLHFGLFHILSLVWRGAGVDARTLMDAPLLSVSLSEFWGRRWNVAFRDLAHTYVFRPAVGACGIAGATVMSFLVSGLVHDFVISFPAGAGYGLPTVYFLLQVLGLLVERSRMGRRLRLGSGITGRVFCAVVVLGPVWLLFHPFFLERVVAPMIEALARF
jgi:hypothetical protein